MSFDADLTACAALVEKGDPERFAASMASPVEARHVLFPLYAFNVEVSRAPWVTQEPMIAEMRLQWWRDALEEIATSDAARRHEVVTPLSRLLDAGAAQTLDRAVAARRWDIYKDAFEDAVHFDAYLDETAGGLMWVAASVLGGRGTGTPLAPACEAPVRALGQAAGLARFLQAVPALETHQRIPLVDGRSTALAELAQSYLSRLPDRSALKRTLPPAARPALIEGFLARAILKQVVRHPQRVAEGTLGVHPLQRSVLLWRAS